VKTLIMSCAVFLSSLCYAEIEPYKSTDNTGINKLERIGVIETYLINLSATLKSMEGKIEANTLKLNNLESSIKTIRETDIKKIQDKLLEKNSAKTPEMAELTKIKEDILALKNDDIEKMRMQIQGLDSSIDSINSFIKRK
jgi:hypothetical protein